MKKNLQIVGLVVFAVWGMVICNAAVADDAQAPTKPKVVRYQYEEVKDVTTAVSPEIALNNGIYLQASYEYAGKVPHQPQRIRLVFTNIVVTDDPILGPIRDRPFSGVEAVYLRFGDVKLRVPVIYKYSDLPPNQFSPLTSFAMDVLSGVIATDVYLQMAQALKIQYLIDSGDPILGRTGGDILPDQISLLKMLADTIPTPETDRPTGVRVAENEPSGHIVAAGDAQKDIPDSQKALSIRLREIKLDGKVRSINIEQRSFILEANTFTLPSGRTGLITAPKPKTVKVRPQTIFRAEGSRTFAFTNLKVGSLVSVVGADEGSGKDLSGRVIVVWKP